MNSSNELKTTEKWTTLIDLAEVEDGSTNYRILYTISSITDGNTKLNYKFMEFTHKELIALSPHLKIENVELQDNELKGAMGSLDRFSKYTWVAIAEYVNKKTGKIEGYLISDAAGNVHAKSLASVLSRCKEIDVYTSKSVDSVNGKKTDSIVPVQNLIYRAASNNTQAHLENFKDSKLHVIYIDPTEIINI